LLALLGKRESENNEVAEIALVKKVIGRGTLFGGLNTS
jgi:hypothetical protein